MDGVWKRAYELHLVAHWSSICVVHFICQILRQEKKKQYGTRTQQRSRIVCHHIPDTLTYRIFVLLIHTVQFTNFHNKKSVSAFAY